MKKGRIRGAGICATILAMQEGGALMATIVEVPLHTLEDIFRLLEYLDKWDGHDDILHFHRSGYGNRFELENALWQLCMKIRQLQGQAVDLYLLTVDGGVTEGEENDLREWVADGNSVYENPYCLYDDSGRPMDFINGCRTGIEMAEDPSRFFKAWPYVVDDGDCADDPPF